MLRQEARAREELVQIGNELSGKGLAPGASGNLSVRIDDDMLITPTGVPLGHLSAIDLVRMPIGGPAELRAPSKEWPLHSALYTANKESQAVVHLHSSFSVAASCLKQSLTDAESSVLTPYFAMRVGELDSIPYFPPGSQELAACLVSAAGTRQAFLLANHGQIVAGSNLMSTVYKAEEVEEWAKLHLILGNRETNSLSSEEVEELRRRFRKE